MMKNKEKKVYQVPVSITEKPVDVIKAVERIRNDLALNTDEFIALYRALNLTALGMAVEDGIRLNCGQLLCSLQGLANQAGVQKSQVRTLIEKLRGARLATTEQMSGNRGQRVTWQGKLANLFETRLSIVSAYVESGEEGER